MLTEQLALAAAALALLLTSQCSQMHLNLQKLFQFL